jgi:Glyoxalase-like domain
VYTGNYATGQHGSTYNPNTGATARAGSATTGNPIQRVDHVVAVVEHFEVAQRLWIEAGCPVVYDGAVSTHRACCVSIGAINLELLSAEAFDGWPALASWCAHAGRRFGLQAVALDPGDLEATVTALRERGLAVSTPRESHLAAPPHALPGARWRISYLDGLAGLLPGLPSFLCEFVSPCAHLGRSLPDGPFQLVELCLGCLDPEATVQGWQRGVGAAHLREGAGYLVRLGDTPIRVVPGEGLTIVVASRGDRQTCARLAAVVPGVRFASLEG